MALNLRKLRFIQATKPKLFRAIVAAQQRKARIAAGTSGRITSLNRTNQGH